MGFFSDIFGGEDTDDGEQAGREFAKQTQPNPFTATSGTGTGAFTPGKAGTTGTLDLQLSPELASAQQDIYGFGKQATGELDNFDTDQFSQDYFKQLQGLRRPAEEQQLSSTLDRLNLSGRSGFGSFTGTTMGAAQNPELAAFYEAQARNQSADAFTSDAQAFQRQNDILKRGLGAFTGGQSLEAPLLQQAQTAGALSQGSDQQRVAGQQGILQGVSADAAANSSGGLFDSLLNTGLQAGLGYLTGGASLAASAAAPSLSQSVGGSMFY